MISGEAAALHRHNPVCATYCLGGWLAQAATIVAIGGQRFTMADRNALALSAFVPRERPPTSESVICTLFEGHYHLGLGALANSLSTAGFNGKLVAGYRGALPPWSEGRCSPGPGGHPTMKCGELELVFVAVATDRHLTNYKPEFMLEIWNTLAPECSRNFYFDPDIVVLARWDFFERWAEAGVALVMDGNTPLPITHPLRAAWRRFFEPRGFKFSSRHDYHFNGGFIGVTRATEHALVAWKDIQTAMAEVVPMNLPIGLQGAPTHMRDRLFPFYLTDQDALNIMADLDGVPLSAMGGEGMGWKIPLGVYMTHALGSPKPWLGLYLRQARRGHAPGHADDVFWRHTQKPIQLFSSSHLQKMKRHMKWAQVLAPFGHWIQSVRSLFARTD
jgi:hypothetical protein